MAGAAFQRSGLCICHTTHHEEDVSTTNNTTLMSPRGIHLRKRFQAPVEETKPCRGRRLLAPVWLIDNISRSLCSSLRQWRWVLEKPYKLLTSPSQGQGWWVWRERGSYSLDLRLCASPFFCQNGPLSFLILHWHMQINPDLNSGKKNTCQVYLLIHVPKGYNQGEFSSPFSSLSLH